MGAEGIFAKPFSLKELVSKVEQALVPMEQRWSTPPLVLPIRTIECHWPDIESPRHAGWLELGRGGIAIMAKLRGIAPGETVGLNIRMDLGPMRLIEGTGVVRWARQGAEPNSTFCGIEFDYLTEECRPAIIEWIRSALQQIGRASCRERV